MNQKQQYMLQTELPAGCFHMITATLHMITATYIAPRNLNHCNYTFSKNMMIYLALKNM